MTLPLQPHHCDAFQRDGFVQIARFVSGSAWAELVRRLASFVSERIHELPDADVFCETCGDLTTLKQIQRLDQHDEYFGQLMREGPFREAAEQLLGGAVVPRNLQYFNKPPRTGQATPPHQDGYYFRLDPCHAVTMWLAIDSADAENGCVRYVPGSHRSGMRLHERTKTLGFSQGITGYPTDSDAAAEVLITAQPGDLLAHHALTIHRADANRSSTRSRRALGFVYFSAAAREDQAASAAYRQQLESDLRKAGRIGLGASHG